MKLNDMPNGPILNTILNAAQHVLAQSDDLDQMLRKADQLLAHEFEDPFTQRNPTTVVIEALKKGNGCVVVWLYVEANGVISGHKVEHEFPRDKETPNYLKVVEVESQAYQETLASIKGKTYTKRTIVRRFLEYTPDMVY